MSRDEILYRLDRIYTSIDAVFEGDLAQFRPSMREDENHFVMYQDFIGGLTPAELSNLAHSVIHNIANLQDHLRHWARQNGEDLTKVDVVVSDSDSLKTIMDLSNNDKHGYPPRGGGLSGKAPTLREITRVLRLSTGGERGSGVAVILTPEGPKQRVTGSASSGGVVTGQVVDSQGRVIGGLYDLEVEALKAWEQALKDFGILP